MTVKELAKLAGVSPATVSLVLNGKKGVSEEKRNQILKLIDESSYRHLKKAETATRNILFIRYSTDGMLLETNAAFVSAIMDGAEQECRARNFNFTMKNCEGSLAETLGSLNYENIYGAMILGTELLEEDYPALSNIPCPYVIVDNSMPHFDCSSVAIDNREDVFKIVEHFVRCGFDRVGYFGGEQKIQNLMEREQGFFEAVDYFKLKMSDDNVFRVPMTMLGAFEQTQKYLEEGFTMPQAIFVDNDTMAIGVMKALMIAGYNIPGDVSVVGFDDINFCTIYSPTISTIHVNKRMLGKMALSILQDTIEIPDFKKVKVRISGDLKLRNSTLPTPRT